MNERDLIRFYANPRTWESNEVRIPGPYSASGSLSKITLDRGKHARALLNEGKTRGSLIRLVCEMLEITLVQAAGNSEIHPGRFNDFVQNLADPFSDERARMAQALGILEEELA